MILPGDIYVIIMPMNAPNCTIKKYYPATKTPSNSLKKITPPMFEYGFTHLH